ncbi:FAD/NAD(P)-binding protein [Phormidium sp. CCY1219]|uniref:FAD/NAD(P)-binding protein n=1 Tax=Phormidium sp. CCY1219 TaxID=2886104 RepID=UPI002D1F1401|nr:FAD/NAD(P)-binding protein [Phormidium sp. CCY1219]MEB3831829.1 lysine N(6)-hydroxylase/L-ornithine N(5)-oxygenase family protein [Phormidium sp. CCY1219]
MNENSALIPCEIDIAIIGAGPQALTLVAHLLQKRKSMRRRFVVFDPSGGWLTQWCHQFAALEIPHLRSPAVHHPDPDPFALRRFAQTRDRELFPPYDLPGTKLFQDFCEKTIARWQLENRVVAAKVRRIEPLFGKRRDRFRLALEGAKSEVMARRVVLATGGGTPHFPDWVSRIQTPYPSDRLCHSHQIDLRQLQLHGERVLIIGGGLTAGHLAIGALKRGAKVMLMMKRQLQEKLFDADPGWLGPKYLKEFSREANWVARWRAIASARNGGSMTPEVATQLRRESHRGNLAIYESCEVVSARWENRQWRIMCDDGAVYECDRIGLATGTRLDVAAEPLLSEVCQVYPPESVGGLPVLDEYLRWPGCELFVMGGLAALQVGPVARNLAGARMASDRISVALTKPSLRRSLGGNYTLAAK